MYNFKVVGLETK